ncbi:MAG: hypothetical protein ABI847_20495, partial [Anaerolineales bacterium]
VGERLPRVWVFLGDASYTVYLTHVMFINAAVLAYNRLGLQAILSPFVTTLLIFALSVMAACVFYIVVERPLLKLLSRRRKTTEPSAQMLPSQL